MRRLVLCMVLLAAKASAQGDGLAPPPRPPAESESPRDVPVESEGPGPQEEPGAAEEGPVEVEAPAASESPSEVAEDSTPSDPASSEVGEEAASAGEEGSEDADPNEAVPDGSGGASAEDAASEEGAEEDRLVAVVIDAAPFGVDPIVGQHVSAEMRETAAELGYAVVSPEDSVAAAQRIAMPYPPPPADLWRVTFVAGAQRGAFARVWAREGRYVIELTVASADGRGPFFARGTSGADDLHDVVEALTREALPPPGSFDEEAAAVILSGGTRDERPTLTTPRILPPPRAQIVRRPRRSTRPGRRFDIALQSDSAIGVSEDSFYNHLIGTRFGIRLTNTFALRLYVAYANLRGRAGREHTILPMAQFETRIRFSSRLDLSVPLRVTAGYLPFNGPVLRFSAGLNLPVSSRVELGVDLLTPTFWFVPDQTLASLNLALEVIYRL